MIFSYTFLNTYGDICPEMCRRLYVLKDVKKTFSQKQDAGIDAHAVMDRHIRMGDSVPPELEFAAGLVSALRAHAEVSSEVALAVDRALAPGRFLEKGSWMPWLRGKFDAVALGRADGPSADAAALAEWKTGKVRESGDQLEIGALLLMARHPRIQKVTGFNVWVGARRVGQPFTFLRTQAGTLWAKWIRRMQEIEQKDATRAWEKRESPLCAYCPVRECENWMGGG